MRRDKDESNGCDANFHLMAVGQDLTWLEKSPHTSPFSPTACSAGWLHEAQKEVSSLPSRTCPSTFHWELVAYGCEESTSYCPTCKYHLDAFKGTVCYGHLCQVDAWRNSYNCNSCNFRSCIEINFTRGGWGSPVVELQYNVAGKPEENYGC